jgi:hypothetical protein
MVSITSTAKTQQRSYVLWLHHNSPSLILLPQLEYEISKSWRMTDGDEVVKYTEEYNTIPYCVLVSPNSEAGSTVSNTIVLICYPNAPNSQLKDHPLVLVHECSFKSRSFPPVLKVVFSIRLSECQTRPVLTIFHFYSVIRLYKITAL